MRVRERWARLVGLLTEVAEAGTRHNVPMMAAAISYYLLVTIAPLALVVAAVVTAFANATATGTESAATLRDSFAAAVSQGGTLVAVVTLGVLLFGASGVFSQFVLAVTRMWDEPPRRGPAYAFARRHALGFLLLGVLAIGLLVSLAAGAMLTALVRELVYLAAAIGLPVPRLDLIMSGRIVVDFLASFLLFWTAFTLIPAHNVRMRDAAPGAAVTSGAYALGQIALGVYLANSSRVALYGSLGAFIAVLLWTYYSALIALYGAELSRLIVLRRESAAVATKSASNVS